MFIMVEGSSKRRGSRYDSMLGPELGSYDDNDGLYDFDDNEDGWAFFFLDDVDAPFPKPPDDEDGGLLKVSTDTVVRIMKI